MTNRNISFTVFRQHQYIYIYIYIYIYYPHYHHQVAQLARISQTLSCLLSIAPGRSRLHPASVQCLWRYVLFDQSTLARPCERFHGRSSFMSSSLSLQQCLACHVRLIWMVLEIGVCGNTTVVFRDVPFRIFLAYIYIYIYIYVCVCVCVCVCARVGIEITQNKYFYLSYHLFIVIYIYIYIYTKICLAQGYNSRACN